MKHKSVIEIETKSLIEEQFILSKFPNAIWVVIGEKTKFYVPYPQHSEVTEALNEWEKSNE